jgi:N-acetylmuramoyl-L-alanine amidase
MILNGVKFRAVLAALLVFTCGATAFAQNSGTPGLHTVVIDPGHGGKDPGAISKDKKSHEKAFVLDISKRMKEKIEAACPDVKVLLTRSDDTYIPLIDRAKYATKNNADVFISVHINASDRSTSVNGYSVHLLGPSDKSKNTYAYNMEVCKRENEVILLEDDYTTTYQGFDPNDPESDIFLHLMHNAYREQSLLFAQIVDNHLKSGPFKKSNGIYQNNFAVLRLATMPAMLLELGFISSTNDLTTLRNKDSRDNLATRLCDAFCEYKKLYDESVGATSAADASNAVAKSASAVVEPVETTEQTSTSGISTSSIVYATQILATTVRKNSADPIFLGYTPLEIKSGRLYKYYIGVSPDVSKAKEYFRTISKTYSDAFVVKVVDGTATRVQ